MAGESKVTTNHQTIKKWEQIKEGKESRFFKFINRNGDQSQ